MTIARQVKDYLDAEGVAYEMVDHPYAASASRIAQAAHVPGDHVAKAVLLHVGKDYRLAVVPCTRRLDLAALQELFGGGVSLASEPEINEIFADCDRGAVPPFGAAYGVPVIVDTSMLGHPAVWVEGGDHRTLLRIAGPDFDRLMRNARQASFSRHV